MPARLIACRAGVGVAMLGLLLAACGGSGEGAETASATAGTAGSEPVAMTVPLEPLGADGTSGTATITPGDGFFEVAVDVPAGADGSHALIVPGTCDDFDPGANSVAALAGLVGGKADNKAFRPPSEITDAPHVVALLAPGPRRPPQPAVACGEIPGT